MKAEHMARIRSLDRIKKLMRQFEGQPEDDMPLDKDDLKQVLDDDAEGIEPEYEEEKEPEMGDEDSDSDDEFEEEKTNFMRRHGRPAPGGKNRVVVVEAIKASPMKKAKM